MLVNGLQIEGLSMLECCMLSFLLVPKNLKAFSLFFFSFGNFPGLIDFTANWFWGNIILPHVAKSLLKASPT